MQIRHNHPCVIERPLHAGMIDLISTHIEINFSFITDNTQNTISSS